MCISGLRAKFTAYYYHHILILPPPNLAMAIAIGGVRTHSYDCPPHTEYVQHLLYV